MPEQSITTPLGLLGESIEALALEIALRDLGSLARIQPLSPMLARVCQEAEAAGMPAVAETAATFSRKIADAASDEELSSIRSALNDAIARMQQLIAGADRPPEAVAHPLPVNQDPELIADFILE